VKRRAELAGQIEMQRIAVAHGTKMEKGRLAQIRQGEA
jgi:hypothetical protein